MTWIDAVGLATRSVSRRLGRTGITIAAVALAAALFSALLLIADTAQTRVLNELSKGGPLSGIKVVAAAPDPGQLDSDAAQTAGARAIDQQSLTRIRAIPGVRSVVPITTTDVLVIASNHGPGGGIDLSRADTSSRSRRNRRFAGGLGETVVGVDLGAATKLPVTLVVGRLPAARSMLEVAVTPTWLERVGVPRERAASIVGTELELGSARVTSTSEGPRFQGRWTRVLVVGVVAQEAAPGGLLASAEQVAAAKEWAASGDRFDGDPGDRSTYAGLFVVASSLDRVPQVRAAITEVGYATSAPENLIASVQRYLRVVEIVLSGIGAIALMIASLGITNALLAAVRERRREIGVLKAIGARDRDILRVFLLEAAVVGIIGGVAGTAAGVVIAKTVGAVVNGYLTSEGLVGVKASSPVGVLVAGVVGATVLAVLAGSLPAWRAARLPAREAVDT